MELAHKTALERRKEGIQVVSKKRAGARVDPKRYSKSYKIAMILSEGLYFGRWIARRRA